MAAVRVWILDRRSSRKGDYSGWLTQRRRDAKIHRSSRNTCTCAALREAASAGEAQRSEGDVHVSAHRHWITVGSHRRTRKPVYFLA